MTGRAKPPAFAAKGKQIFLAAITAPYPGKAVLQVAAGQIIPANLSYDRTKETVLLLKPFFVASFEVIVMVIKQPPQWGGLRFSEMIY
jgi:hypothetical protein